MWVLWQKAGTGAKNWGKAVFLFKKQTNKNIQRTGKVRVVVQTEDHGKFLGNEAHAVERLLKWICPQELLAG